MPVSRKPPVRRKGSPPSSCPIRHQIGGRKISVRQTPPVPKTRFGMPILAGPDGSPCRRARTCGYTDTLDHQIGSFSQQQGSGGSILFTSQYGTVVLSTLPVVSRNGQPFQKPPAPFSGPSTPMGSSQASDVLATLERLGALKTQGVLSDAEFNTKKAELLSRL
jgi:hypothetical protein